MTKTALIQYIAEAYGTEPEYPWPKYPEDRVFRHSSNQKWFALMMDVPKEKMGVPGTGLMEVLNVKSSPILISALRGEAGIYPAYHMNKENWLSIDIQAADEEKLKWLLGISYDLTSVKKKRGERHELCD